MKKLVVFALVIAMLMSFAACAGPQETKPADETAPEISGVKTSITATVNDTIDLLAGVSATDDVDGDITANIQITVMPALTVTNGKITPDKTGSYEIAYKVTDKAGNEAAMYSELTVTAALAEPVVEKEFTFNAASDNGYNTFFFNENGAGPKGTAGLVKGNYQINVTESDNDFWHIKFEKTITTKPGADYKLKYTFNSTVAGVVKLNDQEYNIQVGANTIERTIVAVSGDSLYTELQLGVLPAPFVVDITQVSIEEIIGTDTFTDITPEGFKFNAEGQAWEQFLDDSQGSFSATETSATLNITKPGKDNGVWQSRLFVKAGLDLTAGKKYRISIDVEAAKKYDCLEIVYNNGDVEKGVGALYGQTLEAGVKKTFSITVALEENKDNLIILLQAGQLTDSSNTITVSNLKVEEVGGDKTSETTNYVFTPDGIGTYNDPGTGCEGFLYIQDGKLVYEMTKIGVTDWHNKMMIEDVELGADKYYTIRFTAKANQQIDCAFFLAVQGTEWDPRITETISFTTEEQTYELKMDKTLAIDMIFQILWQFGSAENQALSDVIIEFSKIEILSQQIV